MKLITELRQNNGQFDIDHFIEHMSAYEHTIKSLLNKGDYALVYKILKCYVDQYVKYAGHPVMSYRPGMDFIVSYYAFYTYAQIMEKGIKGIVEPDKKEATRAYLEVLKRIEQVPTNIRNELYENKIHLLLRHAYPDLMDRYSIALYHAGMHFYRLKNYKLAFKLFKKGADFDNSGRQITYPYYLQAKNQDKVADMYRSGLGIEKSISKAIKYYRLCADNLGKKEYQKMGDIYLKQGRYADAFFAYTEINEHWPWQYTLMFTRPRGLKKKLEKIYTVLNGLKERTVRETFALSIMLRSELGCEGQIERGEAMVTNPPKWIERWIDYCMHIKYNQLD